jgi:hypothetical protein
MEGNERAKRGVVLNLLIWGWEGLSDELMIAQGGEVPV